MLWIDFKLYFYVSNHKITANHCCPGSVVNWFQIVFLREQSQESYFYVKTVISCELISNCIFTWAITSLMLVHRWSLRLWIDFKLYFYVSNHKWTQPQTTLSLVVNWFQIVFLREQSQGILKKKYNRYCCELISNCIFTWAITSIYENKMLYD